MLTFGNGKLKKTAKKRNIIVGVFTLPPMITCPRKGVCTAYCYASGGGTYSYPAVLNNMHNNYRVSKTEDFVPKMVEELQTLVDKGKKVNKKIYIRIHDAGDFYNEEYTLKWKHLIDSFGNIEFYAYTKSHVMLKKLGMDKLSNFTMLCSQGGLDDDKIKGPKILVVPEGTEKLPRNTVFGDMGDDLHSVDMVKAGKSVALVAHGSRRNKVA
jgi:hypothetical protein